MTKVLLLGDAQALSPNIALQGCKITLDPGDRPDVAVSDVVASAFAPEGVPLIVMGTGTVADWAARQKRPDAMFVKTPEEVSVKLAEYKNTQKETPVKENNSLLVLTFASKGGVGKTTTATNLAVTLADAGIETVVCDFDLAAPDIATHFNLTPKEGIEKLSEGARACPLLVKAQENLWVLPGPVSSEIPHFTGMELTKAVSELQNKFPVVVGDTPPAAWEKQFLHSVFAQANVVYAVVDQSKFSVRETEIYAPMLLAMGVKPENIKIVVNRFNRKLSSLHSIEKSFCAGFKKNVRTLPKIAAVIPEGWEEQIKAGYKGDILHKDIWLKLAGEIAQRIGRKIEIEPEQENKKRGGILAWLKR